MEERAVQSCEDVEVWRAARQVVHTVYALSRDPGLARDVGLCGQVQQTTTHPSPHSQPQGDGDLAGKADTELQSNDLASRRSEENLGMVC